MKQTSTKEWVPIKKCLVLLFILSGLLFSQTVSAHRVELYTTTGCAAGQNVTIDALITNSPSYTWYSWQYKDGTGVWRCFINGTNSINGVNFTVSGAKGTGVDAPLLTISNATSALEDVQIRVLMRENGEPCGAPAGTTWGGDDLGLDEVKVLRLHIYSPASDCGNTTPGCIGNELTDANGYYGGFENKVYNSGSTTFTDNNFIAGAGLTQYTISQPTAVLPTTSGESTAQIWNNPYTMNTGNGKFAPHTGNFQMIIHAKASTQKKAWYKTVNVVPGGVYAFSVWVARTQGSNAFNLKLTANGVDLISGAVSTTVGQWNQVNASYTVPAGVTSMEISISDVSTSAARYFSLDDICFRLTNCPLLVHNPFTNFNNSSNTGVATSLWLTVKTKISAGDLPNVGDYLLFSNGSLTLNNITSNPAFVNSPVPDGIIIIDNTVAAPVTTYSEASNRWTTKVPVGYTSSGIFITAGIFNSSNGFVGNSGKNSVLQGAFYSNRPQYSSSWYYGLACYQPQFAYAAVAGANQVLPVGGGQPAGTPTTQTGNLVAGGSGGGGSNYTGSNSSTDGFTTCSSPGTLTLGNRVWYDTDNDGIADASENGIANVTVNLYNDANNDNVADGAAIATTTTNSTGYYSFNGLSAGNFIVGVVVPAGYMSSSINGGDPDNNTDLDDNGQVVSGTEVRGLAITLSAGAEPNGNTNNTYDFGLLPDCTCTNSAGNVLINPSFENGTTGWLWTGGTLTTGNGYVACGAANGFNNWSTGTSKVYQDVALSGGSNVVFKGFAGTHTPGITCSPKLSLIFMNAANTILGQYDVTVTRDVDVNFGQLEQYSIATMAPFGSTKVRVQSSITCNTMKLDAFCLTVTPPSSNLVLGNKVFLDHNRSGMFDAGDAPIANAIVRLYADANNDNTPDGAAVATTTTDGNGEYLFSNLSPNNYIVGVVIPNSQYAITVINGGDPDNDIDNDNNALRIVTGEARGNAITLTNGTEPGGTNTNLTYDFGFYDPSLPPNGGKSCFSGSNPIVYAKSYWNVNANSQTVTIRITFAKTFVDNTYGTSAIGWPSGHTFGNLTGSDHLLWSLKDANGVEKLAFKEDYISADATRASGYGTLGFGGDGGTPTVGQASDVLSFRTSMDENFNTYGYILTTNSPVTNNAYAPNATYPKWIYDVWYEITVKASLFGAVGFGYPDVASVHASPSKTGNNTEIVTHASCPEASLGDYVWRDDNKDGVQDAGEPGVSGIVVTLFDSTGKLTGSTVTDAYGKYIFAKLYPGRYTVGFTLPANYTFTSSTGTSETNATNSDVSPLTGRTTTVTLDSSEDQRNIDAGIIFNTNSPKANIGDRVWLDLDRDGAQDAGEPGVSGVTVTLYDNAGNIVATQITDANGYYLFMDVPPGSGYTIGFSAPPGTAFSPKDATADGQDSDADQATGRTAPFTVIAGTTNLTYDAGLMTQLNTKASLGDFVWNDLDHDGIQDAGEPGIPGIVVNLYAADGTTLLNTTATDAFGYYAFTNLDPGTYVVGFVKPAIYTFSPASVAGSNVANDSDPNTGTGKSGSITLVGGDRKTTVDAGMYLTTSPGTFKLGDRVWGDDNQDGVQNASEDGMAGITVILYKNGPDGLPGTVDDIKVGQTTTDKNGNYLFTDLAASAGASTNYNVLFTNIPAGFSFTAQDQTLFGGTDATDSDPNKISGRTGSINLTADNLTVDAGLVQGIPSGKGSIGDRVWYDLAGGTTGVQDANEPGVANVTVKLYRDVNLDGLISGAELTAIATTTTNNLGIYMFGGLDAGNYQVGFSTLPAGYTLTTVDAGADDTKDSDGFALGTSVAGNTATAGTSYTSMIILAPGEDNLTRDLGIVPPVNTNTLGDFVWYDVNNDGFQTAGEPGVKGVMVNLYNSTGVVVVATTVTDENGKYMFTGIADGVYSVGFSNLPAGYSFTAQSATNDLVGSDANALSGQTISVTLGAANRNDRSLDGGLISSRAALGNYVWFDVNMDGVQDATELGIPGATVTITRPGFGLDGIAGNADDALPVASAITDAGGFYYFGNLAAGTYQVAYSTLPGGLSFTKQNSPGDNQNNTNSDADPATGMSALITLSASETDLSIDAGVSPFLPGSVGDYVWYDLNTNGVQDLFESGVGGVVATLYNSSNVAVGAAVTDGSGKYLISNIAPASGYYIVFSAVPTWGTYTTQTSNVTPGDATLGSDPDPATGMTASFPIAAGELLPTVDAGIRGFSLSGNVWHDVNGMNDNLVNNTGPLMVPPAAPIPTGLRISRVDANTGIVIAVALVQGNGAFFFPNVLPGNYILILSPLPGVVGQQAPFATLPTGWINTGEHLGLTPGRDPVINGKLSVSLTNANIINANFGIQLNNDDIGIN